MTDNEIIKALKATASWVCDECKFHGEMCDGDKCEKVIAENALDLINRQKAEIERLQKNIDGLNIFTKNHIKVIRLQAIKEFADRLCDGRVSNDPVVIAVKVELEMTEENENDRT